MNELKHASTDAGADVNENEPCLEKGIPPLKGKEATQTTPKPSDTLTNQRSVITEFDCMHYFLYASRYYAHFILAENLLPAWHSFALHPHLYAAIYSQNFVSPTPIQSQAIPRAQSGRDVIGVAETVSVNHFLPCIFLLLVFRVLGKLSHMVYPFFTSSSWVPLLHHPN